MASDIFLAGAASRTITPPLAERPVWLAGAQRERQATAVHSPLQVRALAMRHGERVVILLSCDLIGLHLSDIEEIRSALSKHNIAADAVVLTCTGTLRGPDTLGFWGDDGPNAIDSVYLATIKRAIEEAAIEALTFGCPVRMRSANTVVPGLPDVAVSAIQFERPSGEILATLMNLDYPPRTVGSQISSDYVGVACQAVEQAVGGLALHVTGAQGVRLAEAAAPSDADAEALGRAYADAVVAALRDRELESIERFESSQQSVWLPISKRAVLQAHAAGKLRQRQLRDVGFVSSFTLIRLGSAQLLAVPGVPTAGLAAILREAMSGDVRMLLSNANDSLGPLLRIGEEPTGAWPLSPGDDAGPRLMFAVRKALE